MNNNDSVNPSNTQQTVAKRILTGIKPTGTLHLGNYVGAIRPAIESIQDSDDEAFFFLADYHGIIGCYDPAIIHESTKSIAATWIACGLDPERVTFYRQSDVPEIPELAWILNCSCAKGLMNRAHAYKAAVDANKETSKVAKEMHGDMEIKNLEDINYNEFDDGISMGLFDYPVLMAADILMFNATHVPVGHDQIQHIEMARDIARTFNFRYKPLFTEPSSVVDDDTPLLKGLDGRKMSKSYGNTIPLFGDGNPQVSAEKQMHKAIMKIVTNSQLPAEPKNPDDSAIFEIYKAFATPEEIAAMRTQFAAGIGWGDAKQALFDKIDSEIAPFRARYQELMANPRELEEILQMGADKARRHSRKQLDKTRRAIGIRPLAKLK
ncbi:tryptophan--tRNA ligase [Psychrobacter frigidicola]|uniref:Tryptophan--tRNA ligase n=1 Tax=Psychrobacter frigidicola TaxID=45611 RepID=A0A5C7A352_9GAMM|nr:tryptophan--tRNA ligase [Psychrobacter frigidicola]TXD97498.1 tryptophan--tRNA ligase [Psychrobacter frigidicola]